MQRRRRSREEWARVVAEWRASGVTAQRFAQLRGIRVSTLRWWASALRRELGHHPAPSSTVEFIEVPPHQELAELQGPHFELTLPNGCRLSFPCDVELPRLADVFAALEVR
jgi:transposase-like protein